MAGRTPLIQQYFKAKAAHPGVLLAMRVGDFYEFYGEDAETAARALEITLTSREDGKDNRIAMAGVPFHSVERYLTRLVQQGHKVALCDQTEDPKKAKGLVRREVTRVLTPGTVVEDAMLQASANNFLLALCVQDGKAGLATLDPSTGDFLATQLEGENLSERVLQEIGRIAPKEVLLAEKDAELGEQAQKLVGTALTPVDEPEADRAHRDLLSQFKVDSLRGFGLEELTVGQAAASMVLDYARHNGLRLDHIEGLAAYSVENFMSLDRSTRRSLELTQNLSDGSRAFTLVATLDETVTPMGARLLRRWIDQPLLERTEIEARHEAVGRIIEHSMTRGDLRDALKEVSDIERLVARCSTGHANPRDLAALRRSLGRLPEVEEAVRKVAIGKWRDLKKQLGDHRKLALTLEKALVEDPPPHLREGGLVKDGFDPELDKLRELSRNGKKYIAELESTEKEKLGVPLKVGYNSVFGYYLEISKAHSPQVPDHYVRKQTTAGAERYITAELKDHESAVLGAQEKAVSVEYDVFQRLRSQISAQAGDLLRTAKAIAEADVITALAESAVRNRYVRPEITDEDVLEIQAGRHPVVEREEANFVPNDSALGVHDGEHARTMILTGPNMSGKSTYLRQNALIALMSQMGSFVPAESCRMGLCDRIFTRIGAKDELALGQSTFMVEMIESANILNNATDRSLVILDEVGRGTSTYDGLAIAWAMVEYLAEKGSKTFFATHYHQLNALADQLRSVRNYRINVEEIGEKVVWTHKVLPGGTDRSYGIHVARMAGVPSRVVDRAHEVLADLESTQDAPTAVGPSLQNVQLQLFEVEDPAVLRHLRSLDPNQLTPMQALAELERMKKEFSNER